jgi:hypothetical protein
LNVNKKRKNSENDWNANEAQRENIEIATKKSNNNNKLV